MATPGWRTISEEAGARFLNRGFDAVSLREVADAVGIKAASLYHHCPGGKAELYVRSVGDRMADLRAALEDAGSGASLRADLAAVAEVLLGSPAIDFRRIVQVDLPSLTAAGGDGAPVLDALHAGTHEPLRRRFERARASGEIRPEVDVDVAAAAVLAIVAGLGWAHDGHGRELVLGAIDLLLRGLRGGGAGGTAQGTDGVAAT